MREDQCDISAARVKPWQFSLRSLMLLVTLACLLFALFTVLPLAWSASIAMLAVMIGLHMAGNAIGTSLRDESTRQSALEQPIASPPAQPDGPPHSLRQTTRLTRGHLIATSLGALLGLIVGSIVFGYSTPNGSLAGTFVGSAACGVLGLFVGLLLSSFFSMAAKAIREAQQPR